MKILIIGGSGGIGFSAVELFLKQFSKGEIVATYHNHCPSLNHPRLQWVRLDVTRESEIEKLSHTLDSIDILLNAVGFLYSSSHRPEKSIGQFDLDFFNTNITLNTLPSVLLAKHFMRSLRSDSNTYFIALSARVGSIKDNKLGGWISYRASKAALNMAIKTISIEWKHKIPNCCVLLFHPGTTDTTLSQPFQKNLPKGQLHDPAITAASLLNLIKKSNPNDTGKFISFDGTEIEW